MKLFPSYRLAHFIDTMRGQPGMTQLFKEIAMPELQFMIRMGLLFGAVIGTVQMITWAATHNHLVLPLFGGFVGLFTDYLALRMIFVPRTPRRYLGLFPWQGLFFKRRQELSRAYARISADALLDPRMLLASVLEGPMADRILALVAREVQSSVQQETGVARPLVELAIGGQRYRELRRTVVEHARQRTPELAEQLGGYADSAFDVETMISEAMMAMPDDQYEGILRPMFKDDEPVVILLGGALGFLVGELQVTLLTQL